MSSPLYLALLGFPSNEMAAFNALFRLAARSGPGFAMVERPDRANVIVANADDAALVQRLQSERLAARVLLIGASDGGTGWPVLARPIQLLEVLDTVQRLGRTYPSRLQAAAAASRAPQAAAWDSADDAVTAYAGLDTGASTVPHRRDAVMASVDDMAAAFATAPSFQTTLAPIDAANDVAPPAFAATVPFSHTLAPSTPSHVAPSRAAPLRAHEASPAFAATVPYTAADVAPRPSAYAPTEPAPLRPEPAPTEFAATVPFSPNEPFAATEPFVPDAAVLAARALPVDGTGDVIDRASIALWREARRVHVPEPAAAAATGSAAIGRRPAPAALRGAVGADRHPVRIEPRFDPVAGALAAAAGRARPWTAPGPDAAPPSPALDNLLVVDADDRSRRSLLNLLGQQGWHVDLARSHDEARRQLARRSYRLVVVGESVQGASVFKTCRALRRHPGLNGSNLRIVLVLDRRRGWLARWRARWAGYDLCVFGAFDPAALGGMLGAAVRAGAAA